MANALNSSMIEAAGGATKVGAMARASSVSDVANGAIDIRPWLDIQGREGQFAWVAGDKTAEVAGDPLHGVYIPAASDTTPGSSGAWKRVFKGGLYPEWFGAAGDDVTNDTAAFAAALAVSPVIQLDRKSYRVADLEIPNGAAIIGVAGGRNNSINASSALKAAAGATCVLDVDGARGLQFRSLLIDGAARTVDGISAGADDMELWDVFFKQCRIGLGSNAGGYTGTTRAYSCIWQSCGTGIRNTIDSHLYGGTISDSYSDGINLEAGSNDNTIHGTKVEWNRGFGFRMNASRNNAFYFGAVDRNYKAGGRILACYQTQITGIFRRNGRDVASLGTDDRCHIYYQGCEGLSIDIQTATGQDDGSTGDITPQYSFRSVGSTAGLNIHGDARGCTGGLILQEDTVAPDAVITAIGLAEARMRDVRMRDGQVRQGRATGTAAVSSSVAVTIPTAKIADGGSRDCKIKLTIKNNTSLARSVIEYRFILCKDGSSTGAFASGLTAGTHIAGTDVTSLISISISAVATDGSSCTVNVANSSATIAFGFVAEII